MGDNSDSARPVGAGLGGENDSGQANLHDETVQGLPSPSGAGRHEGDQLNLGYVLTSLGLLALLLLVSLFALSGLTQHFAAHPPAAGYEQSPLAALPRPTPEPRQQTAPWLDEQAYRAEQLAREERYAWLDRPHGVVQIPVSRAKELLLQEGLPRQAPPHEPKANSDATLAGNRPASSGADAALGSPRP